MSLEMSLETEELYLILVSPQKEIVKIENYIECWNWIVKTNHVYFII